MDFERRLRILAMASAALLPAACGEGPADDTAPYDDEEIAVEHGALIKGVVGSCGGSSSGGVNAGLDLAAAEVAASSPCLQRDASQRGDDSTPRARLPCPPPEDVSARPKDSPCFAGDGALPCPPPED